jgi:cAMP-dependent protein kinase regulator
LGHPSDFFYVIDEGEVEVFLTEADENSVKSIEAGGSFGEMALLYNNPRRATIRASERTRTWRLDGLIYASFKASLS